MSNRPPIPRWQWSQPADPQVAARRAGGRRGYNFRRQGLAFGRRIKIIEMLEASGVGLGWGVQAALARALGVSRSTICRDFAILFRDHCSCPICGSWERREVVERGVEKLARAASSERWWERQHGWRRTDPAAIAKEVVEDGERRKGRGRRTEWPPSTRPPRRLRPVEEVEPGLL